MIHNSIPSTRELRDFQEKRKNLNEVEALMQEELDMIVFGLQNPYVNEMQIYLNPKLIPYLEEKGYKVTQLTELDGWNKIKYKIEW